MSTSALCCQRWASTTRPASSAARLWAHLLARPACALLPLIGILAAARLWAHVSSTSVCAPAACQLRWSLPSCACVCLTRLGGHTSGCLLTSCHAPPGMCVGLAGVWMLPACRVAAAMCSAPCCSAHHVRGGGPSVQNKHGSWCIGVQGFTTQSCDVASLCARLQLHRAEHRQQL